jgi:hypothetical protein
MNNLASDGAIRKKRMCSEAKQDNTVDVSVTKYKKMRRRDIVSSTVAGIWIVYAKRRTVNPPDRSKFGFPGDDGLTDARIVELGARTPIPEHQPHTFLLPRYWQPETWYGALHNTLRDMARAAGCTGRVVPHRLRHSFATEMVRLGVSLPALMQMMGHRDIRMTLRYVEVVQLDLQREFHRAREKTTSLYSIPQLPVLSATAPARVDLATIRQAIVATRRALQLLQPQLEDKNRRKLRRLAQRLLNVDHELDHLTSK